MQIKFQPGKISLILIIVFSALLIITLPFGFGNNYMFGTQTTKTFLFLGFVPVLLFLSSVSCFFNSGKSVKQITWIDLMLIIWFVIIVLKGIFTSEPFTLQFAEFVGLAIVYMVFRKLEHEHDQWLLTAIVISGLAQAVYGNLQLWGVYPSHHSGFKMTGGFFNPGPYAGYLAITFPAALGFYLFPFQSKNLNKPNLQPLIRGVSLAAMVAILLVLPASQSRAAWLAAMVSSAFLLLKKYPLKTLMEKAKIPLWVRKYIVGFAFFVLVAGLTGAYLFKKDSANGRLLIWKVTLKMIADKPLDGFGNGGFKANYMHGQAEYLKENADTPEVQLAGDNAYAFNEVLQQTAEQGIPVTVILLATGFLLLAGAFNKRDSISLSVLLSFFVFSMFSYPLQILPIKLVVVIALAGAAGGTPLCFRFKRKKAEITLSGLEMKNHIPLQQGMKVACPNSVKRVSAVVLFAASLSLAWFGYGFLKTQILAYENWQWACLMYNTGSYSESVEEYEKIYPVLKFDGDFLTNYGKALSMAGNHEKAVGILTEATKRFPSTVVYTTLGDSYKALGKTTHAEAAYWKAWYMAPARFYPKYQLAKFYHETGQNEKAVAIARELLDKPVKVHSTAIDEIREEMKEILKTITAK